MDLTEHRKIKSRVSCGKHVYWCFRGEETRPGLLASSNFLFCSLRTLTPENPFQPGGEQIRGGIKVSLAYPLLPREVWSSAQPMSASCSPTGFGSPRGGRGRLAFPFKSIFSAHSLTQKQAIKQCQSPEKEPSAPGTALLGLQVQGQPRWASRSRVSLSGAPGPGLASLGLRSKVSLTGVPVKGKPCWGSKSKVNLSWGSKVSLTGALGPGSASLGL